jgi:hypothetical protein
VKSVFENPLSEAIKHRVLQVNQYNKRFVIEEILLYTPKRATTMDSLKEEVKKILVWVGRSFMIFVKTGYDVRTNRYLCEKEP